MNNKNHHRLTQALAALTLAAATTPAPAAVWTGAHPFSPLWNATQSIGFDTLYTNWDPNTFIPDFQTVQFGNQFPLGAFTSGTPTLDIPRQVTSLEINHTGTQEIIADTSFHLALLTGIIDRAATSTGTHTIGSNIYVPEDATWPINGSGTLIINGTITGESNLTKSGTATLQLAGTDHNTYIHTTTVTNGILQLAKPTNINAVPNNITINGPATLEHDTASDEQIPDTATVTLNHTSALYNLDDNTETVAAIQQTLGTLQIQGGTLNTNTYNAQNATINARSGTINIANPHTPAPSDEGIYITNANFTLHNTTLNADAPPIELLNNIRDITLNNAATLNVTGTTLINLKGKLYPDPGFTTTGGSLIANNGSFNLAPTATLDARGGTSARDIAPDHAGNLTFAAATSNIQGTLHLDGRNGPHADEETGFPSYDPAVEALPGSHAGSITLLGTAQLTLSGTFNMSGGHGGNGRVDTFTFDPDQATNGAHGGHAGTINVQNGTLTIDNATATLTGGNGGIGPDADGFAGNGGNAGNGGQINIQNGTVNIQNNTQLNLTPGTPHPGGTGNHPDRNGSPGAPGLNGAINLTGGTLNIHSALITADTSISPSTDPINLIATTVNLSGPANLQLHDNTTLNNTNLTLTTPATLTTQPDKSLTLNNNATLTTNANTTINTTTINNGTINAPPSPDAITFTNHLSGQGNYTGHIKPQSTYAPGNSIATNNITGDLTLTPTTTLQIEANTTTPGTDHDQINITQNLTLDGTLQVAPFNDTPDSTIDDAPYGTTYPIIDFATRTPNTFFTNITGTLIPEDTTYALAPLLNESTNEFTLRATIPGDLNLDNKVSVADLATFALNFGTTPGLYIELTNQNSWQLGDFNTDGQITVADLSLLALNFGFDAADLTSAPIGLSLTDAALLAGIDPTTIPEPTTALWMGLSILWLPRRMTRSHTQPPHQI